MENMGSIDCICRDSEKCLVGLSKISGSGLQHSARLCGAKAKVEGFSQSKAIINGQQVVSKNASKPCFFSYDLCVCLLYRSPDRVGIHHMTPQSSSFGISNI